MGIPTIRIQDNRRIWRRFWVCRSFIEADDTPLTVQRWRPSLLWRVMHRLGVA